MLIKSKTKKKIMKKYESPVMKLHQLKAGRILAGSNNVKPTPNAGGASTQSYEDAGFNGDDLFED